MRRLERKRLDTFFTKARNKTPREEIFLSLKLKRANKRKGQEDIPQESKQTYKESRQDEASKFLR